MRGLFGLVGLVVVLAIVGLVAKKQLSATRAPAAALQQAPIAGTGVSVPVVNPTGNVQQQSQQVQQQVQQQLDEIAKQRSQAMGEAEK